MKSASKSSIAKQRPIVISALAAKVLGHTRTLGTPLSTRQITAAFPSLSSMELDFAMTELTDKDLLSQDGHDEAATYALTERGRLSRISVS